MTRTDNNKIRRSLYTNGAELHVREAADGEAQSRTIAGYAILFDVPSANLGYGDVEIREIIAPGAITQELLDGCDIKFTMYHDRQLLLGRSNHGEGTLRYFVDEKGVGFELELPASPNGDEALELVRRGDIAGCSFAFTADYGDPAMVVRQVGTGASGNRLITYTVHAVTGVCDFTLASDPAYPDTSVEARERAALESTATKVEQQLREMRAEAARRIP